ncbi:MAG: DUF503 domain-containing protein [Proteobacteria bacterium]|nr:DUF503 domain-containing protein [Pseudomonadota bacterium]
MVGVLKLDLYLPGNDSLKGKRQVLKGMLERIIREFQVSALEVGDGDLWQRTQLGVVTAGRSRTQVTVKFQELRDWLDKYRQVEVINAEEEIIAL